MQTTETATSPPGEEQTPKEEPPRGKIREAGIGTHNAADRTGRPAAGGGEAKQTHTVVFGSGRCHSEA